MTGHVNQLGLEDRVVIVTGAAGGMGRAFAGGFAEADAKVVAADVVLEGAEETAENISGKSGLAVRGVCRQVQAHGGRWPATGPVTSSKQPC